MRRGADRQASSDAGFTLFELLAVIAILAVVAAVTVPRAGAGRPAASLRLASSGLAAAMTEAHAEARRTNREIEVVLDLVSRTYRIGRDGRTRRLPAGIAIAAGSRPGEPIATPRAVVRFRPDGSASGGWIGLSAGRARANLSIDWLTGATTVAVTR